jgi:SAM-dependent methyltransferase
MTIGRAVNAAFAPFDEQFRDRLSDEEERGALVCASDPALVDFRAHAPESLARLSARLSELWRTSPSARVIWLQSGSAAFGLDDFEAEAVIGPWMTVDAIRQVDADGQKHLAALGSLRDEILALTFCAPPDARAKDLDSALQAVAAAEVPVTVFLSAKLASSIAADSERASAWRAATGRRVALALHVPTERTTTALSAPRAEVAAVRALCERPIQCVRFDAGSSLGGLELTRFMGEAGLSCDCSLVAVEEERHSPALSREGPYTRTSPYRPLAFDWRIPSYRPDGNGWIEIAPTVLPQGGLAAWWNRRSTGFGAELAPRLDTTRMEEFFRLSRIDPLESHRYADVRIYNWPAPAPSPRSALVDAGMLDRAASATSADVSALQTHAGSRLQFVDIDRLIDRARAEVDARFATSADAALAIQHEEHGYLAAVGDDAPLRADYAEFATFVPGALDDTLELGSGYGALAEVLALRARRYIRFDLDARMFANLRQDLAQSGVVGDMQRLPFRDGAFSTIVANNVLEHFYDPASGFAEVRRVLRPGGRLFALIPLDALNNRHELRAHYWKTDLEGIGHAVGHAGLAIARLVPISLYELGVVGAFPSCDGYSAMLEACVDGPDVGLSPKPVDRVSRGGRVTGRRLAAVHEYARFHAWKNRRVLVVGDDQNDDGAEFARFGADVVSCGIEELASGSDGADLVYSFLGVGPPQLATFAAAAHRRLVAGGSLVTVFRNARSLHLAAAIRAFAGNVCDLDELVGPDGTMQLVEHDERIGRSSYVSVEAVEAAFGGFGACQVVCRHLDASDIPGVQASGAPAAFWTWLAGICGRLVIAHATK